MEAVQQFYNMNQQGLNLLNQSFVVLIPKKDCPKTVSDYRPISLTHSFAKLMSKLLANRLGPELDQLITINQTAFIKNISIHDDFAYVQGAVRYLHKKGFQHYLSNLTYQRTSTR